MKDKIKKTNVMRIFDQYKLKYNYYKNEKNNLSDKRDNVFKTLVTTSKSNEHYVFVIPINKELDLKKAAIAVSEKSVSMIKMKELLPLTGYVHGGCSPIGMKKQFKTIIDIDAFAYDLIIFSAGKIGFQVEIDLKSLSEVLDYEIFEVSI